MSRLLSRFPARLVTILAACLALAGSAAAQTPLDLTMTTDLYCGDPATSGVLGGGWNVATVGNLCNGTVVTGGTANAYGVNLLTPTQLTISVTASAIQLNVLSGPPYYADNCIAASNVIATNPTLSVCLPAGYYSILLSSPLNIIMPFEIALTCQPCEPVAAEAQSWGALKGSFR